MKKLIIPFLIIICIGISSCREKTSKKVKNVHETKTTKTTKLKIVKKDSVYTKYSKLKNMCLNFNSPKAINKIAKIENEYFNNYNLNLSKYYGTQWYSTVGQNQLDSLTVFQKYVLEKNVKLDSMHCTIYAVKALKSGFGKEFKNIQKQHQKIWKDREYAGWSLGYILVKYYNWKAYLIISKKSEEYNSCLKNFKKDKTYHVWRQPNIPIEKFFDFDRDKEAINKLLNEQEFGWGFSNQGWHTWITRFDELKECNWMGAPAKKYDIENNKPLFLKTKFTEFLDYDSHIVIFPLKK